MITSIFHISRCFAVFAVLLILTGCSSMGVKKLESRMSNLESRLSELENEQVAVKKQVEQPPATVLVAPEPQKPARAPEDLTKKDVQRALSSAGYYKGAVDGKFGPRTRKAIRRFQADHGLKVDGIVGRRTRRAIVQYINW